MIYKRAILFLFTVGCTALPVTTHAQGTLLDAAGQAVGPLVDAGRQALDAAGRAANCITGGGDRLRCLVQTFGPGGVNACKGAAGTVGVFSAADCDNAYQSAQQAATGADATIDNALNCTADPVGCIKKLADDSGATDPGLSNMAILSGNVAFDTGGLLSNDFGMTQIRIMPPDASRASTACQALVGAWFNTAYAAEGIITLTTGGPYRMVVPACGPVTYTLQPTNPLFSWTPPTRTVTVGNDGQNAQAAAVNQGGGSTRHQQYVQDQQSNGSQPASQQQAINTGGQNASPQAAQQQTNGTGSKGSGKSPRKYYKVK